MFQNLKRSHTPISMEYETYLFYLLTLIVTSLTTTKISGAT